MDCGVPRGGVRARTHAQSLSARATLSPSSPLPAAPRNPAPSPPASPPSSLRAISASRDERARQGEAHVGPDGAVARVRLADRERVLEIDEPLGLAMQQEERLAAREERNRIRPRAELLRLRTERLLRVGHRPGRVPRLACRAPARPSLRQSLLRAPPSRGARAPCSRTSPRRCRPRAARGRERTCCSATRRTSSRRRGGSRSSRSPTRTSTAPRRPSRAG